MDALHRRLTWLVWVGAWLVAAGACTGAGYQVAGSSTRLALVPLKDVDRHSQANQASRARPRLVLRVDQAKLLASREWTGKVLAQLLIRPPNERRLVVALDRGPQVTIQYALPVGYRLPLRPGRSIRLRYHLPSPGARFEGPALIVRDDEGALLGAIAAGGGLPDGALGPDVDISPSHRVVYTEVTQLPSLCLAVIVHRYLRVRVGTEVPTRIMAPGTLLRMELDGRPYRLVVADVAEPEDERCRSEAPAHSSFAILADARRPTVRRRGPPR